jgi:WD40 repeat protein
MGARVDCMSFSPSGDVLACGSLDSSLIFFSLVQNKTFKEQRMAHTGGVKDLFFIDNNTILSAGQDCVSRKWAI